MIEKNGYQKVIALRRRMLARLFSHIARRRIGGDEKKRTELNTLRKKCFAMCKIANGCDYGTVDRKLREMGFEVKLVTLKAWTRSLAQRLSGWQEGAASSEKKRRLSAKELESFLLDNRLARHRLRRGADKKHVAFQTLNKYAAHFPFGVEPWARWKDLDILFFLRTGCIPPRVAVKNGFVNADTESRDRLSLTLWQGQYSMWIDDYPNGEAWQQLVGSMAKVEQECEGFKFRVMPEETVVDISLRTVWTLRDLAGQKTRRKGLRCIEENEKSESDLA